MEALGVSASVTAIITIAIQSAKALSETINSIRHGPQEVQQLVVAVDDLHRVLKQLAEVTKDRDDTDRGSLDGLRRLTQRCISDLTGFQTQLGKLNVTEAEGRLGRAWKGVKSIIKRDDMRRMWVVVHHHVQGFGLQLDIVSRHMDIVHGNNLDRLETTFGSFMRTIATQFEEFKTDSHTTRDQHLNALGQNSGNTKTLTNMTEKQIIRGQELVLSPFEITPRALDDVGSKLENLSMISEELHNTLNAKLDRLLLLVQELWQSREEQLGCPRIGIHASHATIPVDVEPDEASNDYVRSITDDGLSESINRLCLLGPKEKEMVSSSEAQSIIDDPERDPLVTCDESLSRPENHNQKNGKKRRWEEVCGEESAQSKKQLRHMHRTKKMRGMLITSRSVALHGKGLS